MSLIDALVGSIQSIAILLVLGGMLAAFLWKISAIINSIIGFLVTIVLAYIVYAMTENIIGAIAVFAIGLGVTSVIAALGALTCILEGFGLSALGFWGFFATNSPSSVFSYGLIIAAVISAVISTAIAVFIGGRLISTDTLKVGTKPLGLVASIKYLLGKGDSSQRRRQYQRATPLKVEILSDEKLEITNQNQSPQMPQHVTKDNFIQNRQTINEQIANLETELRNGNISQAIAEKLRKELQDNLRLNEQNYLESSTAEIDTINQETSKLNNDLSSFYKQRKDLLEQNNELDARFRIGQLKSKEELERKQTVLNRKINLLNYKITKSHERVKQLNDRKTSISSSMKKIKMESQIGDSETEKSA